MPGFNEELDNAFMRLRQKYNDDIYSKAFIDSLVSEIPLFLIAKNIPKFDRSFYEFNGVVSAIFNSYTHGREFIDLLSVNDKSVYAYNFFVSNFNSLGNSKLPESMVTCNYFLRKIITENENRLHEFIKPIMAPIAEHCFENMVAVAGDPYDVLKYMNVLEIQACSKSLAKYGIELFPSEIIENRKDHSLYFMRELSRELLEPTFDLLADMHGAFAAQRMMSDAATPGGIFIYLRCKDLEKIWKGNPVSFLKMAVSQKDSFYNDLIVYTVAALRNDGKIGILDELPQKIVRSFIAESILTTDDLHVMPKSYENNKRTVISSDLGL